MDLERWEKRYVSGDLPWDSGQPDVHLSHMLEAFDIAPGTALDLGCGTGTNAVWLCQRGFSVTGVDVSATAVQAAQRRAEACAGGRCRFHTLDVLTQPVPDAPFALAYDRGCFHTFDQPEHRAAFATAVAAALGDDGIWISVIGSTDGPPREEGPPRRSARDVADAVEPCFEILLLESTQFDPLRHRDKRAWLLVARKRSL